METNELKQSAELDRAIEQKLIALGHKDMVDELLKSESKNVYFDMFTFLIEQYDATIINLQNLLSRADDNCPPTQEHRVQDEVRDVLDCIDTDLDDPDSQAQVIITGIGLTKKQYQEYLDSCEEPE